MMSGYQTKTFLPGTELGKGVVYVGDILDEVRLMTGAMALGIAIEALKPLSLQERGWPLDNTLNFPTH